MAPNGPKKGLGFRHGLCRLQVRTNCVHSAPPGWQQWPPTQRHKLGTRV